MEAFKEKSAGFLMVAGAAVCVISLILAFMFAGGGIFHATATRDATTGRITDMGDSYLALIGVLGFVVGCFMIGIPVVFGLLHTKNRFEGTVLTVPNVQVVARYGYTKQWVMITNDYEFETADNPTYFLRLEVGPGEVKEFECRPEVYFSAGEGMYGEAMLKGKWCGRFAPYIGIPNATGERV
jgi:hypothetical protein